jgi:amidohydrolase
MTKTIKAAAIETIDDAANAVWSLATSIFGNPELSGQEYFARDACVAALVEAGFTIELVPEVPTAFVATLEGGDPDGPTIGILAEYDALPGIGHGCAHHLIAGSAVAAGLGLASVRTALRGTVKVFGCPAEETLVGKRAMLDAGVFDGIDGALSFHAHEATSVMARSTGYRELTFSFAGQPSHAATQPWAGASALDGVLLTMQNVNALRQLVQDGVRIHGIVTDGGEAPNVIPAFAQCRFGVRSSDLDELERVVQRMIDCARAGALASGTELTIEHGARADPVRLDDDLAAIVRGNLEQLGEHVVDWEASASTDFGDVSQRFPGVIVTVATWRPGTPFHSHDATSQGDAAQARAAMLQGGKAMAASAIDYTRHLMDTHQQEEQE